MGALIKGVGVILIGEGLISVFLSKDKRSISQLGRLMRIGIGAGMVLINTGEAAPPPTCSPDGIQQCFGDDLYQCVNGEWVIFEPNSPQCTGQIPQIYEFFTPTPGGSTIGEYITASTYYGQIFAAGTVGPNIPHFLDSIKIRMRADGAYTGLVECRLYELDGANPPSTPIETSAPVDTSTLPVTSYAMATFDFTGSTTIELGKQYCAVVVPLGSTRCFVSIEESGPVYPLGVWQLAFGSTWTFQPNWSLHFEEYGIGL